MATPAVLQRLQGRAAQAEQIIAQLRAKLDVIRTSAVQNACKDEEAQLRAENETLKRQVDDLRQKLVQAEIRNGLTQVPLPVRGPAPVSSAIASTSQAAPPAAAQTPAATDDTPVKEPPKKQAKKEKKGGEAKPKGGGGQAAPAAPVDVSRLNMRVGHIVKATRHPDADGLYMEEVDLGEERHRTILSGLVKHVPIEQMQDRLAVFMINLKPAKMRGILSEGMIMCASTPEKVEILEPPPGAAIGDQVTVAGYPGEPDAQLNPKKKVWEAVQPDLTVNEEGLATYKGVAWNVAGKGPCKAPSLTKVPIK